MQSGMGPGSELTESSTRGCTGVLPPGADLLAHVSRNALFLTMRNVGLPATSRQLHESSCARCGPGATAEPNCLQVCLACKHLGGGR